MFPFVFDLGGLATGRWWSMGAVPFILMFIECVVFVSFFVE
jgi:hypothetical protein